MPSAPCTNCATKPIPSSSMNSVVTEFPPSPSNADAERARQGAIGRGQLARSPARAFADLIDDAGALPDQSFTHAMQCLQVELVGALGGNELHRRALPPFSNRVRLPII